MSDVSTIVGTVEKNTATIVGSIETECILVGSVAIPTGYSVETEEKNVTPTSSVQVVTPSSGKLISKVTVGAIPNNYGLITYNGFEITVS